MTCDTDPTAALQVAREPPRESDVYLHADGSLVQLHSALVDGLTDALLAALRECPGDRRGDYRRELREVGVDALDGRLADALATLRAGMDRDADAAPADALRDALDLLDGIGSGQAPGGVPSDRADLLDALPPLLAATSEPAATPTVAVRLGVEWSGRPTAQRSAMLRYLAELATGATVCLVTTDAAAARILDAHASDVPPHVLRQCRDRFPGRGPDAADAGPRETAADARRSLDPDARPVGVVRALSASPTGSLGYDDLADRMALDSRPYEAVRTAADHGLVERTERPDGRTVVSLRPAGDCLLDSLAAADGGRGSASAAAAESVGSRSAGDSDTPQISPSMPCYPRSWDGGDPDADAADGDPQPPAEAAAEAAGLDRTERYQHGLVEPRYADRVDWIPACEHADDGALSFIDVDLSARLDEDRDGRAPLVSYDRDTDTAYVGIEYSNPLQSAVSLAHGLTSDLLLDPLDAGERMGEDLDGLDVSERAVLWSAVCLGWLPAEVDTGDDYVAELTDARDDLLELSGAAAHDDSVTRSEVTRQALGLIGTMVSLLDLLGVDVVTEIRVPECSRHYSSHGNSDRRDDLLDHLRWLSALSSRVGAYSAFRQLHEDREDRREDAFTPGFDGGDHPRTGSLRAGLVVTGDGVESLAEDLRDDGLDPRPVHDDAPPISVSVDVETGTSRRRTARTARRMLRSRNLRPTPEAVAVLTGVASTPWAVSEAVHHGLEREDSLRDVYLDETRRALSTLDADRLLPSMAPAARAGVAALLDADAPISQAELARRAGISAQSWRNHRDGLVAADWVRETDGWRLALPFRSERHDETPVARPPWWLQRDADRGRMDSRHVSDVLDWLHYQRGVLDAADPLDPDDALGHALQVTDAGLPRAAVDPGAARAALEAAGVPPDLVLAGCGGDAGDPPDSAPVGMGRSTRQTTLG